MSSTIEVFADVSCPFAHVGLRRLAGRRERSDLSMTLLVRAWPLELVNGAPLDPSLVGKKVEALRDQVAPDLFSGFDEKAFPATFLPAMALVACGYRQGQVEGERLSLAVRDAIFERGWDVADPAVLQVIAKQCRVAGEVEPVDHAVVLEDWAEGRRRGVVGSPHFFFGGADFFCPSLTISKVDGHLDITADAHAFDRFFETTSS